MKAILRKKDQKITRLLLTRHGETMWNVEKRLQGHTDIELNATGIEQAEALAARLAGANPVAIYTSDLSRAAKTAAIIKEKNPVSELVKTPELRERNWGAFEGKKWREVEEAMPHEIEKLRTNPFDYQPVDGESRADVLARIKKFISGVIARHPGDFVVIVTHGGICSLMIKHMMGMDLGSVTPFRVENCSVSVVDHIREDVWFVHCLNDMSHLTDVKVI